MTSPRTYLLLGVAATAAVSVLFVHSGPDQGEAWAQRRPRPACNIATIPFVEGNEWVYKAVTLDKDGDGAKPSRRQGPKQPEEFRVKVESVKVEGQNAEITLHETAKDQYDLKTVIKCGRDQIIVSPESFFFMGEPGGGIKIALDNLEQPGPSYPLRFGKLIRGAEKSEYIKADLVRKPADGTGAVHMPAKLDIQRKVLVGGVLEDITTEMGTFKTVQTRTELLGAVKVEASSPGDQPNELLFPEGNLSALWFAEGTGMVQAINRFGHTYQLVNATLN